MFHALIQLPFVQFIGNTIAQIAGWGFVTWMFVEFCHIFSQFVFSHH